MALATSTLIGLALAGAGAGASYYNTTQTAKREDKALATQIRNQGDKQRKADAKVNESVDKLKTSTADESRRKGLDAYMQSLLANRGKLQAGLSNDYGSQAFQDASKTAAQGVDSYATDTADLLSRIDAPGQQRQNEAFGYGKLATDLGLIGREAQGQNFIDQLLVQRASRRNPWLDALSSGLSGAAGAMGSGGFGFGGNSGTVSKLLKTGTGVTTINNGLDLAGYT